MYFRMETFPLLQDSEMWFSVAATKEYSFFWIAKEIHNPPLRVQKRLHLKASSIRYSIFVEPVPRKTPIRTH